MVATLLVALVLVAPPAWFPQNAGWQLGSARLEAAGCSRCVQTESWASTVRYADPPNQLPPHRTMAKLRRDGIIIHVTRSWEPAAPRWVRQRHPLRIRQAAIHANFEGNTTGGRVSLWQGATWRSGSYMSVFVFFGAPVPSAATVARAQAELDAVQLPAWHLGR